MGQGLDNRNGLDPHPYSPDTAIGTGIECPSEDGWLYLLILSDTDHISRDEQQPDFLRPMKMPLLGRCAGVA